MNTSYISTLTGSCFEPHHATEFRLETNYKKVAFEISTCASWTLLEGRGEISRNDLFAAIRTHFPHLTVKDIIWDFSEASLAGMSRRDFEQLTDAVKRYGGERHNAKTAFVGSTSETYSLSCIYVGVSGLAEVPIEYSVFRTLEEAERWIGAN